MKFIQHNWKIYKYLRTFWKPRVNRNLIDEKWKGYNSLLFKETLGDFKKVKKPDYLNFYIVKKELPNQLFKKQMKTRDFPFQNPRSVFLVKLCFHDFFLKWKILDLLLTCNRSKNSGFTFSFLSYPVLNSNWTFFRQGTNFNVRHKC